MSPTRREVLAAFLGVPAALAACRRTGARRPRMPEGALAFEPERLGHRARDATGDPPNPPPDAWERVPVVIVGGGVAGYAAAWRLARAGFGDYTLLELASAPGGTSRSGRSAIGSYPWGAHYITAPMQHNRALIALLSELGALDGTDDHGEPIAREQYLCREPEERLFYRGRWYEDLYLEAGASREDLAQRAAFDREIGRLAAWRDARGRRAFAVPTAIATDDAEIMALDRITMAEWMRARGLTSERLRWYVDYACRDDYGLTADHTSAWAGLFYFAARVRHADSEYQPVITWPEGNGRLIAHLARAAGERARLGWAACDVRHPDNTADSDAAPVAPAGPSAAAASAANAANAATGAPPIEVVALTDRARAARGIRADHVIFAAPRFVARHVIRAFRGDGDDARRARAHADAFEYGPWMVANLSLRERPGGRGFPLAWDNVLYDSPSLGYVVSTHQRGLDHGPTVITYYYPVTDPDARAARERMLAAGWAEWADIALADLERAHPELRAICDRIDVARWGHAMIRPRPGFVSGPARRAAIAPWRGVHFAHSDLSGVALFEEAFDHGVRAAEEVLAARGVAFESLR